jgi:hypothetical protein
MPDGGEHPFDLVLPSFVKHEFDASGAEPASPGRCSEAVVELDALA